MFPKEHRPNQSPENIQIISSLPLKYILIDAGKEILTALDTFEKEITSEEGKIILTAFKGFFNISVDMHAASEMMGKVKTFTETHKDVDSYLFSSYYKLCYTYYAAKGKYKLFYTSALQYLAYTQSQEIE